MSLSDEHYGIAQSDWDYFQSLTPEEKIKQYEKTTKIIEEREKEREKHEIFMRAIPAVFFGGTALAHMAAVEAAAAEVAAAEAGAMTLPEMAETWLAPEALPALGETMGTTVAPAGPSFLDKAYNWGKEIADVAGTYVGLTKQYKQVENIINPPINPNADTTGAQEYEKLTNQYYLTEGQAIPGQAVESPAGSNMIYIAGGILLLLLLARK